MTVKPDIKKPWKYTYEQNNIKFEYMGNTLNIWCRSQYNQPKLIQSYERFNTIKPVFINHTDFILFNDYKNPLYFKYNSAVYDYDVTTLKLAAHTYDEYMKVMDVQEVYCAKYIEHEWYSSVQIPSDKEDRVGQVDLIVTFDIDDDVDIIVTIDENKTLNENKANLRKGVDVDVDDFKYVMRSLIAQITFGIENLDKGELIYHRYRYI